MRRRLAAIGCLALTATLGTVPATAATCGRASAERHNRWFVSTPPLPPHTQLHQLVHGAATAFAAVAADPGDRRVLVVSTGTHVLRTDDGGCSWAEVYALPPAPSVLPPDRDTGWITSVDVARVDGRSRVLLTVQHVTEHLPGVLRTVVVRSADGVGGWQVVADVPGASDSFAFRPLVRSVRNVAYLAAPAPHGGVGYHRSVDGGLTWALRSSPADLTAATTFRSFEINPWQPDELWEWDSRRSRDDADRPGLRTSTDGGATWTWYDPWQSHATTPSWREVNVAWPRRGGPARILVLGSANDGSAGLAPVVAWSGDGGATFRLGSTPPNVDLRDARATHLANGDAIVHLTNRTTYRIPVRGRPPVRADWRSMPRPPERFSSGVLDYHPLAVGGGRPAVLVAATLHSVQLLAVPR